VASGHKYTARFIIDTSGVLANPHIPDIKGADSFQGAKFHSGQWDHSVTYKGKRVGVIGSGCSAAQIVPAIANQVDKLTLFMGNVQWVIPRSDRNYNVPERFFLNLPVIRQINRFIILSYHAVRFIAFRRYRFTLRISNELRKRGTFVSPSRVRSIWLHNDLACFKQRLKSLSDRVAEDGIILTEAQVAAMERKKHDDDACGEIDTAHPGYQFYMALNILSTQKPK